MDQNPKLRQGSIQIRGSSKPVRSVKSKKEPSVDRPFRWKHFQVQFFILLVQFLFHWIFISFEMLVWEKQR